MASGVFGVSQLFNALGDAIAIVERTGGDALEIGFYSVPGLIMGCLAWG